jgi:hypothetical protein
MPWTRFQAEPPSDEELAAWDASNFNVSIVTGAPSDIVVLDVDSAEAQEVVDGLDLPITQTVRTGRGRHYEGRAVAPPAALQLFG